MQEILDLKQQLLLGNFDKAIDRAIELETMVRQDKINVINNYLTFILSKLIIIQLSDRISLNHIIEIRNALLQIQQRNRLSNRWYIEQDSQWLSLIGRSFSLALLIAAEDRELQDRLSVEEVRNKVDSQFLRIEALLLIRLTYDLNAQQIDRYLRFRWRETTVT